MIWQAVREATALFFCLYLTSISSAPAKAAAPTGTSPAPALATPAPKFEPVPGAIVNGLTGLAAATAGLKDFRSIQRTMIFRTALAEALSPGLDLAKPVTIRPSNNLVLCSMRGQYSAIAAQTTYITSLTNTVNQFATPPTISTLGDAFKSIFQSYSIDANGKVKPVESSSVVKNCQADIDAWPVSYYGVKLGVGGLKEALVFDLGADLSAFSALLSALNNIITPIATAGAQSLDSARRAQAITSYLNDPKIQGGLLNAATSLAANGNVMIKANRLQALGVFEEKLAAVRTFKIDLSKIDSCKVALAAPQVARTAPASSGSSDGTASIPTDEFVSCYAQAWAQLNDPVQATLTAAAQYDALADAPSDQLTNAVATIKKNIGDLKKPTVTVDELFDAATQLITLGKAITTALSSDNIKALQTDAENVMKLFK
jgi:hypothetical protein